MLGDGVHMGWGIWAWMEKKGAANEWCWASQMLGCYQVGLSGGSE